MICKRSSATPLRSMAIPITMKVGNATRTKFSAARPQILGAKLKNSFNENTSNAKPTTPKIIDNLNCNISTDFFYLTLTLTIPNLLISWVSLSGISASIAYLTSFKRGQNLPICSSIN